MNTNTITCRCGAVADVACVDLTEHLCLGCWVNFDDWAQANRDAYYSDWPGRSA